MVFSQYLCLPVCKVGSKLDSGQLGPGLWVGGPLDLYAVCMTAWDDHPLLPFLEVSADPCPECFLDAGPAGIPCGPPALSCHQVFCPVAPPPSHLPKARLSSL